MGYTHSKPLIPASYHIAGGPPQLMGVGASHWLAAYPPSSLQAWALGSLAALQHADWPILALLQQLVSESIP